MKISPINRLLLILLTLIVALFTVFVLVFFIAIASNIIPIDTLANLLKDFEPTWQFFLVSILISVFLFFISIKLLFTSTKTPTPNSALLKYTELGLIKVSINALEVMVQKAISSFEEIKDAKISVLYEADVLKIRLKVLVMPDMVLPDLSVSLQKKVKEYIETYAGIAVEEVFVYIDNLTAPVQRPKVQ